MSGFGRWNPKQEEDSEPRAFMLNPEEAMVISLALLTLLDELPKQRAWLAGMLAANGWDDQKMHDFTAGWFARCIAISAPPERVAQA